MQNNNQYNLFIDELGSATLKDLRSNVYILAGCCVNERERHAIKVWSDQIKFKYWGKTEIVFHSREIGRKENDYSIFKDKKVFQAFLEDLSKFLFESKFKLFFIIVDKEKAKAKDWDDLKIHRDTAYWMVKNFVLLLLTGNCNGKIVSESATAEKDFYIHKSASYFLAGGLSDIGVSCKKVQQCLTSIAFVTKRNYDIEEQIADLFAYAARCSYLLSRKMKLKIGPYEKLMLRLLKNKLFKLPIAKARKMRYFKEIKPFLVLP